MTREKRETGVLLKTVFPDAEGFEGFSMPGVIDLPKNP